MKVFLFGTNQTTAVTQGYYQWQHVNNILSRPLHDSYQAEVVENFKWEDWVDPQKTFSRPFTRSDTRLKNHPYRETPVVEVK